MFTVISNIRNSKMYLIVAAVVTLLAVLAIAIAPPIVLRPSSNDPASVDLSLPARAVVIPPTGGQAASVGDAIRELRQEELSLDNSSMAYSPGSATFDEYDLGEFRREELLLYNYSAASMSETSACTVPVIDQSSIHTVYDEELGITLTKSDSGPTGVDGGLIELLSNSRSCSQ
jgi:hypothetical protein